MEYIDYQVSEGIAPRKFIVGDIGPDGHVHVFYLRDDLPRATSTNYMGPGKTWPHQHSIEEGPNNTLICIEATVGNTSHFHSLFTEEV